MTLWIFPVIVWCVHGTMVSVGDVLVTVARPLAAIAPAAILAFFVKGHLGVALRPLPRLCLENAVLFIAYFSVLLFVAGQKDLYLELLRGLRGSVSNGDKKVVSDLRTSAPS
jgi:PST family polysaccharide transporter